MDDRDTGPPRAAEATTSPLAALPPREKARLAHERLCDEFGCPIAYFRAHDPLSELVGSLLSHRTRNADSGRAFKALRARFGTWAAVRDAPVADVEATIAGVTWPELKAPRLQQVLRAVTERVGHVEPHALDFLGDLAPDAARAWLEALPGVGPKTSAAVLSFSTLRGTALPVDSHHHRVAVRLGLIPATMAPGPSHAALAALLPPGFSAQQVYDHHEVFMLHGQRTCTWKAPRCERCVVLDLCPYGEALVARLRADAANATDAANAPAPPE